MFRNLGAMALGHMDETTLSATLDNFDKFRKVHEDFQKLSEELAKRLYEGKDDKQKNEFFELVGKFERETELEKRIEIDITEIDKDDFIAGVVKGKKDARVHEIVAFFAPMFKEEEKKETDFSELDEFLK